MKILQEETSAYITSGKWIEKGEPSVREILSGMPATSASIILPALDRNTLWNSLKNMFKNTWKFFSSKLKPKSPSNQVE